MANETRDEDLKGTLKAFGVKPQPQPENVNVREYSWNEILGNLEVVEEGLESMPGETSNVKHFARIELANSVARAREILEALAADEEKQR